MTLATGLLWGLAAGCAVVAAAYVGLRAVPAVRLPPALYPYGGLCVTAGYLGLVYAAPLGYDPVRLVVGLLGFVASYFTSEAGELFTDRVADENGR